MNTKPVREVANCMVEAVMISPKKAKVKGSTPRGLTAVFWLLAICPA
jgi:hypothetical protein